MNKFLTTLLLLLSSSVLLSGCALFQVKAETTPKLEIAPNQWLQLPTPAQLDLTLEATQILRANYQINGRTKTYTSQVQVEANRNRLVLVAISPWGGELFSIDYNGTRIDSTSLPMPNAAMGVKHTLTDFMLTYASPQLIQQLLRNTSIVFQYSQHKRLFLLKGKPFISITYSGKTPWISQIAFKNTLLNYTLYIKTVSVIPCQKNVSS